MANLVELYDLVIQAQSFNGVPLSHGHVYVYALGRTKLMDTWSDIDGESLNTNPVILDNAGQAHIYVSDSFDYTLVFTDEYDNEVFSVDKYLLSKGEHSHADVAVAPSEHIGVSSYHVGGVTVYVPYLTGEVGKTYEGIDPIVVNNTLNRISANHIPLGVQDPLYFVEDSESACILGCSAQTEIPSALSSKWDEASDVVIANSAQWAEGAGYEAGSYVSIDNNTINVTGLQPEGDYAYNSALSSKLDVTALPQDLVHSGDLTAYYPTSNPSGFITGVDLSDYATNEDLQTVSADITAMIPTALTGDYLTKESADTLYQPIGNYLSSTDSANFLLTSTSGNFYTTDNPSGFITGIDLPQSANWNATTNTVSSNSAAWSSATPQIPVTGINGIKISESGDQVVFEVSGDYLQNTDLTIVDNKITEISGVPLSAGDELPESVSAATDYITATSGNINATITNVSENSAAWGGDALPISARDGLDLELSDDVLWIGASALNDALTSKQDITGMTAYQPVGDYLTTADSAEFYTTANESGFITGVDLTPYMLTADMTAYQTAGSYLSSTDSANFLLTSDSANFYTTANESGFLTDVPETYLQNTDLEISDNKITGISGVPLAAGGGGGDVPEGVMAESGLEFNAVNEISGYNGSAIAQYGAEKQFLQHDDTIVHVANSAQYAFGVNLSAVAQLLGVDETLLWSGTITATGQSVNLNEPISNFSKLKFVLSMDSTQYEYVDNNADRSLYTVSWQNMSNNDVYLQWMRISANNDKTKIAIDKSKALAWPGGTTAVNATAGYVNWEWTVRALTKVIGIGRKA